MTTARIKQVLEEIDRARNLILDVLLIVTEHEETIKRELEKPQIVFDLDGNKLLQ